MTRPEPPVRLILDRSALLAYLAGSMDVAETLHEVTQDGVCYGIPTITAADTLASVDDPHDRAVLLRLFDNDACVLVDTHGGQVQELAFWQQSTGRLDTAAAVLAALDHEAWLLTGEPKCYDENLSIIEIGAG